MVGVIEEGAGATGIPRGIGGVEDGVGAGGLLLLEGAAAEGGVGGEPRGEGVRGQGGAGGEEVDGAEGEVELS